MHRRHFLSTTALATGAILSSSAKAASSDKLKVAVIGHTGRGAYGHGLDTMWLKIPETRIVAVADADAKGLEGAQKKLNLDKGYADYKVMLKESKPDIVSIGPRFIDEHFDMTMAAIESGAKGIYMEKPFCRTLEEADAIVEACQKKGVKLALAHRNRYHPVLPVLTKLIKEGAIGRLLEWRMRGKEDQRGGSLDMWVLGSHLFNLTCYLGGKPVSCSATVMQAGHPATKADIAEGGEATGPLTGDEVHARFMLESGIPAYFDSVKGAGDKNAGFGVQAIGTGGIIDLRIDTEPLAHMLPGNPFQPKKDPRSWTIISTAGIGQPEPLPNLKDEVGGHLTAGKDLIAAMKENREPLCSAEEGRQTLEMIMGVFESHRLNGQSVALPLKSRKHPLTLL